jgi:hypothetical protein
VYRSSKRPLTMSLSKMQYLASSFAFVATALVSLSAAATPYCTSQGAGNCNLVYTCSSEIGSDNVDCGMMLYDYTCTQIGGYWISPDQGSVLYSQLPYTIDVDYTLGVYTSDIQYNFRYAAGKYGTGISNCYDGDCSHDGIVACEFATCSFPC